MSLYGSAVKRPIMTTLCFVAVVILGLFSLNKLPIDLYPDIETNTIMVMTTYSGASAQDIEQNVTRPLENVLNSVNDLKHITSKSRENISVITLEFEYGEDIDVLTNDVRDKLDMVSSMLPDDAENPIIFKFSTDMIPIIILSVRASESMPGLYKILDDAVANPLARINGVGSVSISGAPKREIHIYVDPVRLEAYNLSVEQIGSIIGAENRNIPGGSFDIGSETYALRVQGESMIYAGNINPSWTGSWRNEFSWNGLSLGFMFTARVGGVGVSLTEATLDSFGMSQRTADARDMGGALVNGQLLPAQSYYETIGGNGLDALGAYYTYSMTNIRLGELTVGYDIPVEKWQKVIKKLNVSFVGRNLAMLYCKAPFDPESVSGAGNYSAGIDYFMMPSTRNLGFSVKVTF